MITYNAEKPKILLLFSDTGGGHRSAAEALVEAIELEYGNRISTEMVDFFRHYTPWPLHNAPETYPKMVKIPKIWEAGYHISNGRRRVNLLHSIIWPFVKPGLMRLLEEHPSNLVVSVHPLINEPMTRILAKKQIPYYVVVTDLVTTHAFWYQKNTSLTIVPTRPAFERGVTFGVSPERMRVVGLPVADRFCRSVGTVENIRKSLGWPKDISMIVLIGGGDGMGPLEQTAKAIAASGLKAGLAIVTGRNQALKTRLENHTWAIPTFIYGSVKEMPKFMQAAHILVTQGGPGTVSEALISHLPMIIYSYLPGQETGNVTYVTEKGAGIFASSPEKIVAALAHWLNQPGSYQQAVAACKLLARPEAAREISHFLAASLGVTS